MRIADYIVITLIAVAVILALRVVIKNKKQGKTCNGDCANCGKGCK
ncbi:MAG: FeoB-associated Cys-rich membrane protein [Clostridia bacterium]|nr:FeoB-associated Cys-rich membrane protein [Clostridia bacterium]